jgi:quercetin dioxygenase-like cupin family protein
VIEVGIMLKPIRRVVTGHNAQGRSAIIYDGNTPTVYGSSDWPTRGVTMIWGDDRMPPNNNGNALAEQRMQLAPLPAGATGATFMIMHLPPESELDALQPEVQARVTIPVARTFPGAFELDTSRGYGMHGTDTVDYIVILSGEVSLLVDEGEVTLKAGDTVIQRGVNHGWINRGKEVCLVAAVAIKAEPISRDAYNVREQPKVDTVNFR